MLIPIVQHVLLNYFFLFEFEQSPRWIGPLLVLRLIGQFLMPALPQTSPPLLPPHQRWPPRLRGLRRSCGSSGNAVHCRPPPADTLQTSQNRSSAESLPGPQIVQPASADGAARGSALHWSRQDWKSSAAATGTPGIFPSAGYNRPLLNLSPANVPAPDPSALTAPPHKVKASEPARQLSAFSGSSFSGSAR